MEGHNEEDKRGMIHLISGVLLLIDVRRTILVSLCKSLKKSMLPTLISLLNSK